MANESFQNLYLENQLSLLYYAKQLTKSEQDAKDLLQKASIKAYLNRNKLNDSSKFKAWMGRILYNTHMSAYRKAARRRSLMEEKGSHTNAFFNRVSCNNNGLENLKVEDIENLRNHVNADAFEAFEMYSKGYSYKEIAASFDIAIGTVKSRIFNTRKRVGRLAKALGLAA